MQNSKTGDEWQQATAATSNGARLREGLLDRSNTASDVWADTAYRSNANEDFMDSQGLVSKIHRKKLYLKPMKLRIQRSNTEKSVILTHIEHIFADQKSQTGLFIRKVGIARVAMRIGPANVITNMHCLLFFEKINVAA